MPKRSEAKPAGRQAQTKESKEKQDQKKAAPVPMINRRDTGEREIVYPDVKVKVCQLDSAITASLAKELLEWEEEPDFTKRMLDAHPDYKDAECKYGEEYTLRIERKTTDDEGKEVWKSVKVKCWNNSHNRPFKERWARSVAQDILNRNWAGPTTMPEETINGETISIGRTGLVESGQHRLIGLVLAYMLWDGEVKDRPGQKYHWQELWPPEEYPNGPVLESLVVLGVSESQKVIRTLDNVMPRDAGDVFYTSSVFLDLTSPQRKECTNMLSRCIPFLKGRVIDPEKNIYHRYLTNSEAMLFVEEHPRILEAIRHLFDCNNGSDDREVCGIPIKVSRSISSLKLSVGECAAVMYLMGTSDTPEQSCEAYRALDNPSEAGLSFNNWDTAMEFWASVAAGQIPAMNAELAKLATEDATTDSWKVRKMAIICKAWKAFLEAPKQTITSRMLRIKNIKGSDGLYYLDRNDLSNFGGIDLGDDSSHEDSVTPKSAASDIARANAARTANPALGTARPSASTKKKSGSPTGKKTIMDIEVPPPGSPPVAHEGGEAEETEALEESSQEPMDGEGESGDEELVQEASEQEGDPEQQQD